ncbi:S1C family serine protease [Streptacidiphilus sp. MAP5-3]|uniref:S1C family serine protease n=1 Tax=unclassified Streptacidiphilus TaxID=2643834 RepID=UPI003516896A
MSASTPSSTAISISRVDAGMVDLLSQQDLAGTAAAGTGIVLTSNGEVLTNNHVITGSTSLSGVDIGNGRTYTASVIGYDRTHDLALVQLHGASGLQTLQLDPAAKVAVGDAVTALGNAGGKGGTPAVATGSVTAVDQQIIASDEGSGSSEQLNGLIQVDAPIQAGDSGGPLLDASGQVIGIDTAASVSYQFQTGPAEGFAIPAVQAQTTAAAIAAGQSSGTVHIGPTAWLGVGVGAANASVAGTSGAEILQVVPGSPADGLGLAPGDIITSLDGKQVADPTALTRMLDLHHPGDSVTLGWTDANGHAQSSPLRLGSGPEG